jgi:hypothetical protein
MEPPLDLACLECLNVIVATQFAIDEQLKDLIHMFYLQIPCYKLYKEGLFFYVFTLKYICHFGMTLVFNLKAKHKIKNKVLWLFFNALSLVCFLPFYLPIVMYDLHSTYIYIYISKI